MRRIRGEVQHYDWGDPTFIPNLLGVEPDGRPWAELWLGTHPNGPAVLDDGTPLIEFSGPLPYLLKVLACVEPLSLQTHPNSEQARAGFTAGYFADEGPKPELLCALTTFEAFCGVRPVVATLSLLSELGIDPLARILADDGPVAALAALYQGELDAKSIVDACAESSRPEAVWVNRLAVRYPGDPSVAVTLLLNHVALEPGEAIRLEPGNLHAYLNGAGIELMAASDNVVRGGFTSKPVDVDLLLDVSDATPLVDPVIAPGGRYGLPDAGIALLRIDAGAQHVAVGHELAIDMAGNASYYAPGDLLIAHDVTYIVTPL